MTTIILPDLAGTALKRTRIAYENLFEYPGAVIAVDSEAVGYEVEQAYDWRTYTLWKPDSVGEHIITCTLPVPRPVNYFAFYAHTLHDNGATIALEYSLDAGVTWTAAASAEPSTGAPVYLTFEPITAARWRVVVDSTPASLLGVVAFGTDMPLERGVWRGFSPPIFARDTELTNTTSESGSFLGRSIDRQWSASALDLEHLTAAWVRSTWLPFVLHAEIKPWFLLWDALDYPDDAAFCWAEGKIPKPAISQAYLMTAGVTFRCKVE